MRVKRKCAIPFVVKLRLYMKIEMEVEKKDEKSYLMAAWQKKKEHSSDKQFELCTVVLRTSVVKARRKGGRGRHWEKGLLSVFSLAFRLAFAHLFIVLTRKITNEEQIEVWPTQMVRWYGIDGRVGTETTIPQNAAYPLPLWLKSRSIPNLFRASFLFFLLPSFLLRSCYFIYGPDMRQGDLRCFVRDDVKKARSRDEFVMKAIGLRQGRYDSSRVDERTEVWMDDFAGMWNGRGCDFAL